MARRDFVKRVAVVLSLVGLVGCASNKQADGLVDVNDFLTCIERVHVNSELAQERVKQAVASLKTLVAFDFRGEAVTAYQAYVATVQASAKQVEELRESSLAMDDAAQPVFKQWAQDLESFTSLEMRLRSQNRLMETRARYDAIVAAVGPAQAAYDAFNVKLNDYMIYLGHDFNAASVKPLQAEMRPLSESVALLDSKLVACESAARAYVEAASLPTAVSPSPEASPASVKTPAKAQPKTPARREPRADG